MKKTLSEVELELSRLGFRNRLFGRAEVRELQHILSEDEVMSNVATGRYEGGLCSLGCNRSATATHRQKDLVLELRGRAL